MGDTAHQREPGRRLGLDRHPARRQADAHGGRRSAPRAGRDGGARSSARRPTSSTVTDGVVSAAGNRDEEGLLRRADRRPLLQRPARLEQADRQRALRARQGAAEEAAATTRSSASRSSATTSRRRCSAQEDFCHRRQGAGHGARPHDPPAGRGRGAGRGRRELDQGHPGRQGRLARRTSSASSPTRNGTRSRRAEKLKVEWSNATPPFPEQAALYDHIRKAPVRKREVEQADRQRRRGVQDRGARDRGRIRMAVPVARQHGPGLRAWSRSRTARSTCWTGSQKPHFVRDGVAAHARHAADKVHGIWVTGPGSYGRNDAGDCRDGRRGAGQGGRQAGARCNTCATQGTGWDPKGPASIHRARAALDAHGNVVAYEFLSKGFSRIDVDTNESKPQRHARRPPARRRR